MSPALLALVLALAQGVAATPTPPMPPARPTPSAPPPRPEAPPYEAELLRLSELMGALTFLRDLCQDGDGARYRDEIARLIQSDPRPQETKDQLAGAFNRGFQGYRLTYRACTSNARATIDAYLEETQRLAKEVASRFGG